MNNYSNNPELLKMVQKYLAGKATPEEKEFIEAYYNFFDRDENILDRLLTEEKILLEQQIEEGIMARIEMPDHGKVKQLWNPFIRIVAAAVVLIFLSVGAYFILHKQPQQQIVENTPQDIAPGGNKAILTLGDGKIITLTDAKNGKLADQGSIAISKKDGQVVYTTSGTPLAETGDKVAYNSIVTPRGGQYHLTLADGTNVWLNAESSIRYPTAFTGSDRKVEITGEAYFEVAHNAAKPFKVASNGQIVEVLGTHFNINAYRDEPAIKTTLLEGSVKVVNGKEIALLIPGQQSQVRMGTTNPKINIVKANTEEAIAWKNGYFLLDGEKIENIMRKVSRWYNVEIDYQDKPDVAFGGSISRFENVSQLLDVLQRTGSVHFKIEGRRITVMK